MGSDALPGPSAGTGTGGPGKPRFTGKTAIVTGAGGGIGGALARQLAGEGAKVLAADLDGERIAGAIAGLPAGAVLPMAADAADAGDIESMIARAEQELGPVDLYFANAGVLEGVSLADEGEWERAIDVNLLAGVRAARLLLPDWLRRRAGHFVLTASAAGLLTQIGNAPYSATKHAAVGFAEWLSITYGDRGVAVSCLCPMGVDTALLNDGIGRPGEAGLAARVVVEAGTVLSPEEVAAVTLDGVLERRFLILPHPEVLDFVRRKTADHERWVAGMRRLQAQVSGLPAAPGHEPEGEPDP